MIQWKKVAENFKVDPMWKGAIEEEKQRKQREEEEKRLEKEKKQEK